MVLDLLVNFHAIQNWSLEALTNRGLLLSSIVPTTFFLLKTGIIRSYCSSECKSLLNNGYFYMINIIIVNDTFFLISNKNVYI